MRTIITLIILSLLATYFPLNGNCQTNELHYSISPLPQDSGYHLLVELRFTGNQEGNSLLILPNDWGGSMDMYHCITNLKIDGILDLKEEGPEQKKITYTPGSTIYLSYELFQDFVYPIQEHNNAYRPILQADFFHLIGTSTFIYPNEYKQQEGKVTIDWKGFPEDWLIHNSFSSGVRQTESRDTSFLEALYLGGDYRVHTFEINQQPVNVVMRGDEWTFADSSFLNLLEKVVSYQRHFWNDFHFPYYTVTLTPYMEDARGSSYLGTGLENAFALFATPNVDFSGFYHFFSHEMMHEWIGRQITNAAPEEERYWFSEGFTEYYAYINLLESGLFDTDQYIQAMNTILKDYYLSPFRSATNKEIAINFFEKYQTYGRLAYDKGCVFALMLDWQIQIDSKGKYSLKDVLNELLRITKERDCRLSDSLFVASINSFVSSDIRSHFEKYMHKGEVIPLAGSPSSAKWTLEHQVVDAFDLGFNLDKALESKHIAEINESSNAFKAGLRNGQRIRSYSLYHNQTTSPVEITIEEDGEEKVISYLPVSKSTEAIPQLRSLLK